MFYYRGVTTVELLAVLVISSILLFLASPGLQRWQQRQQQYANFNQLLQLVKSARELALTSHYPVTLCPSSDQIQCSPDWGQPLMIFTDNNQNERIDGTDVLLRQQRYRWSAGQLWLAASANKRYLQFKPSGVSNGVAGNIRLLSAGQPISAYSLVISLSGRVALRRD